MEPGTIPQKEPIIKVAIVLPDDNFKKIVINTPENGRYVLVDGCGVSVDLLLNERYEFHLDDNEIVVVLPNKETLRSSKWVIKDDNNPALFGPRYGIKVKNVIIGRRFHWRKLMDMYVPGDVAFCVHNGHLLVINELSLEKYIMCVATSEMGAKCPKSFLEALTIAARSWFLANTGVKHKELGVDVCNDDCCQRYQGTTFLTKESIDSASCTYGKILFYDDKIVDARYSKSCGGIIETYHNIWDGDPIPYSKSKIDGPPGYSHPGYPIDSEDKFLLWLNDKPQTYCSSYYIPEKELAKYLGGVDVESRYFRWLVNYSQQQLNEVVKSKLGINSKFILDMIALNRGASGRITKLQIDYMNFKGEKDSVVLDGESKIRNSLSKKFLYSSAFYVEKKPNGSDIPREFTIKGAGWGHGVGMCQIGALGMSLKGFTVEDILYHYYTNTEIVKVY